MALFDDLQQSNLRSCVQMIEEVIAALGHPLDEARIPNADPPAWWIRKGSALLFVRLRSRAGKNYLRVYAPVIKLDAQVDEHALFRYLLQLNAEATFGAAFALEGSQIVLTSERSTVDLDRSEVEELVTHVAHYADQYDDELVAKFGGTLAGQS